MLHISSKLINGKNALLKKYKTSLHPGGCSNPYNNYVITTYKHTIRVTQHDRKHETGNDNLFEQYFSNDPIYHPQVFQERFRMQISLFRRIMNKIVVTNENFQQKRNVVEHLGMT